MFSAVCLPQKRLHSSITDCGNQLFEIKWHVIPKKPFIWRFDHKSSVRDIDSVTSRISASFLLISLSFSATRVDEKCFREGTTNRGSRISVKALKAGASTIEKGSICSATTRTNALLAWICHLSAGAYFLGLKMESTFICSVDVEVDADCLAYAS